jgi:hypothetical protein
METASDTVEGHRQTVRLPSSVFVRRDGDPVVLEPAKPKTWPEEKSREFIENGAGACAKA